MILENRYTALDTVRLLRKAGMTGLLTDNAWVQGEFVRPEIYEKHPGLSDDGYTGLTKKWGGPYAHNEVYEKKWRVIRQCPIEDLGNLPAPTLWEAVQWLIENRNVWVTALPDQNRNENETEQRLVWTWNARFISKDDSIVTLTSYQTGDHADSWERAMGDGLFVAAWVLDRVKPEDLFNRWYSYRFPNNLLRIRKAVEGHHKFVSKL